jgi:hypothetical protein
VHGPVRDVQEGPGAALVAGGVREHQPRRRGLRAQMNAMICTQPGGGRSLCCRASSSRPCPAGRPAGLPNLEPWPS